jgi:iron complex outermembrane receptor protein
VDRSRLERTLLSLALDFTPTDSTRLELNASRYHYVDMGFPGTFALDENIRFPDPPDPKTVGYGQPYGGDDNATKTFSGRLKYAFNSDSLALNGHMQTGLLSHELLLSNTGFNWSR